MFKRITKIFFAFFLTPVFGFAAITTQDVIDVIVGKTLVSDALLKEIDRNLDGKVDVSDVVMSPSTNTVPLVGNKWLLMASFSPNTDISNSLSLAYSFILDISQATALVGTLVDFDPTKSLFQQRFATSGEQVGVNRFPYALSSVIPAGVSFTYEENVNTATLVSNFLVVAADASTNPTGRALQRRWTITIDKAKLNGDELIKGSITAEIVGLLPEGRAVTSNGNVHMIYVSPVQPEKIQ